MKVIAIIDYDVMPPEFLKIGGEKVDIVKYACSKRVFLLRGVELSCDTEIEDVHIMVFGCDFTGERFRKIKAEIKKSKVISYKKLIADKGVGSYMAGRQEYGADRLGLCDWQGKTGSLRCDWLDQGDWRFEHFGAPVYDQPHINSAGSV